MHASADQRGRSRSSSRCSQMVMFTSSGSSSSPGYRNERPAPPDARGGRHRRQADGACRRGLIRFARRRHRQRRHRGRRLRGVRRPRARARPPRTAPWRARRGSGRILRRGDRGGRVAGEVRRRERRRAPARRPEDASAFRTAVSPQSMLGRDEVLLGELARSSPPRDPAARRPRPCRRRSRARRRTRGRAEAGLELRLGVVRSRGRLRVVTPANARPPGRLPGRAQHRGRQRLERRFEAPRDAGRAPRRSRAPARAKAPRATLQTAPRAPTPRDDCDPSAPRAGRARRLGARAPPPARPSRSPTTS